MKVAIVYNRESQKVINLFGQPNQEKYGQKSIERIVNALRKGGHQVKDFEGDKELIPNLEQFMPRVMKSERPGMVFNLSYGIQGQARYTHVPGILEMIGIPYVGSGPLAHSLALDKVVSKMIFCQKGLPTPDFCVLDDPASPIPSGLTYPLIVKPKNEAVSFGLQIVNNEEELRAGAKVIFDKFDQAVLVEQYIAGREVNVGILGNGDHPDVFMPAEIVFGEGGPKIYTFEDKTRTSGRQISVVCPADIGEELTKAAQEIAIGAFRALGCYDCARVDMRLDDKGKLYILEINSLPSLGEHGSYVEGARQAGLDFPALVNRLVDVASARYFGTPRPYELSNQSSDPSASAFNFLTSRRDQMERLLQEWTLCHSRTNDPIGIRSAFDKLDRTLLELGLKAAETYSNDYDARVWSSPSRFEGGTLLIAHVDIPQNHSSTHQPFRRDPEHLYGEGIGSSRAPLVQIENVIRALRHVRLLKKVPLGVLAYGDEGSDCNRSAEIIRKAAAKAKRVFVLRPGNVPDQFVVQRRGLRKYQLLIDGKPSRLGQVSKQPTVMNWTFEMLNAVTALSSRKERIAVAPTSLHSSSFPSLLPHRVEVVLLVNYLDEKKVNAVEKKIRDTLGKSSGIQWRLELISDRPPLPERAANVELGEELRKVAQKLEIPLESESSLWPSVAGLIPSETAVVCGLGPIAHNLSTPEESIHRISLLQRTLLLTHYLIQDTIENAS